MFDTEGFFLAAFAKDAGARGLLWRVKVVVFGVGNGIGHARNSAREADTKGLLGFAYVG